MATKSKTNATVSNPIQEEEKILGIENRTLTKSFTLNAFRSKPWQSCDAQSQYFKKKAEEWKSLPNNLIDTHCHFDKLFPR